MKRIDSEFVGVCLDTGNNIALLEEPTAMVEALAPWTFTVHLKDMGVEESKNGFLLSEVPLGAGCSTSRRSSRPSVKSNPKARFNLEMITRDPLSIPCLTDKYWATLERVPAAIWPGCWRGSMRERRRSRFRGLAGCPLRNR